MANAEDTLAHEERKRKWREAGARYRAKQSSDQKARDAERARAWRQNNKDRWNEIAVAWRDKNREKWNAYCREWSRNHPEVGKSERAKNYRKGWYQRNRDKKQEQLAARKAENPEYYRIMAVLASTKWRNKNIAEYRQKSRAASHKRRARKANAGGTHTSSDIKDILRSQKSKCAYCRKSVKRGYHVDHIKALSVGGSNDRRNLQITCRKCNLRKNAKDPIVFAQSLGLLL